MPLHGLKSGLAIRGMQSGLGSGNTIASIESGYRGGMHNALPNKDKMLNPANLTGTKKPLIYGLADFYNITGGNTTNLNDIANTGNYWQSNGSVASRPIPYADELGGKTILKYEGSSAVMRMALNESSLTATAVTVMCMIKLNGTAGLSVIDTGQITIGAIYVSTPSSGASACQLRSRFYSATSTGSIYTSDVGPTSSSSIANTPEEFKDYMLLTCKFRMNQPGGPGSEQHMFINGRFHQILSSDAFVSSNTNTFNIPSLGIGNAGPTQNALALGFEMGMGLILPYWLENAEQEKIENYFRWYYNKSF